VADYSKDVYVLRFITLIVTTVVFALTAGVAGSYLLAHPHWINFCLVLLSVLLTISSSLFFMRFLQPLLTELFIYRERCTSKCFQCKKLPAHFVCELEAHRLKKKRKLARQSEI